MHGVTPLCITLCGFAFSLSHTAAAAAEEWKDNVEGKNGKNGEEKIRQEEQNRRLQVEHFDASDDV